MLKLKVIAHYGLFIAFALITGPFVLLSPFSVFCNSMAYTLNAEYEALKAKLDK